MQNTAEFDLRKLFDSLPVETKKSLSEIGITSVDIQQLSGLDFGRVFEKIFSLFGENSHTAFTGMSVCLGIMILCSLTEGVNINLSDKKLNGVSNAVSTMCICTAGHQVTGGSYYAIMMTAGNAVSAVSARLVSPLMNVFLALTVTSSLSQKMNLSSLCESVYKFAKWSLTFVMSIFTAVLSLQTIMSSSMDNVSKKALRFAVSSFVPVVGGALGEALNTFNGSIELLKSGAGVFVIIAGAFIILPVAFECIVWQFSMFVLSSAGDIMGLSSMTKIFKSVSKAVAMMTGLLFCVLAVVVISTGMILLIGR